MSKPIIKWGILGTSYISGVIAQAISASATSQLMAIGSRSSAGARDFADKFSVPKCYDDYQALLNDPEIDAIYIGLPNHLHKEWMIRCAQAGKHILCEKPLVTSARDAREIISILAGTNVFCMEAQMYRCHPFTKKLQQLMQQKVLGEVKLYHALYNANIAEIANPTAGGAIRNLGCYPVSLIRLLANAEPVAISSTGRINPKTKSDSQASAILKFADDSMAVVSTADDLEMVWRFEIFGTEGHLQVVTNPWLPAEDNNKILIYKNGALAPIEINVTADKSLYTYQIDTVNQQITKRNSSEFDGITLADSLSNIIVLEQWLNQVKASQSRATSDVS